MTEKNGRKEEERGPLLGPIKKPVSASVSESLLRHSRQLRKHLKAPEKPDNTSLVECRVPPGGRCDFAPCHRDTELLRDPSMCCNIATIPCIKHRLPTLPPRRACEPPAPALSPPGISHGRTSIDHVKAILRRQKCDAACREWTKES